jgi:hypothetical protein
MTALPSDDGVGHTSGGGGGGIYVHRQSILIFVYTAPMVPVVEMPTR